jgi:hypothetical protein
MLLFFVYVKLLFRETLKRTVLSERYRMKVTLLRKNICHIIVNNY